MDRDKMLGADPRPQWGAALDQVHALIDEVGPGQIDAPTPCAEFTVRTLVAHLVAVLRKVTTVRSGGDFASVTDPAVDVGDDGTDAFRLARQELESAWLPPGALDEEYVLPYGTMTGRELLDAYSHEFTVHAGDLHRALGSDRALDPALSEAALTWYRRNVPAEGRERGGPFAPAVEVGTEADVHTRLAAYVGRPVGTTNRP